MAIQDPVEDSISGDSGVGTVKTVVKTEPGMDEEELVGATGGTEMWPTLPQHHFKFSPQAKTMVEVMVHTILRDTDMTLGKSQILTVLTTMQYLAKVGPAK